MTRLAFLIARQTLRALGVERPQALFIMGHMRCGSTLLLHILLTNPRLIGYGERNAAYLSNEDLDKLELAARIAQRAPFRDAGYAVDQINHDRFTPSPDLLGNERVRCVFLIRDPQPTIQSIVSLTQTFYEPWTIARAVDYYTLRLQTLAGYAKSMGREMLSLTYDELVDETPSMLRRLESFLCLREKLREEYAIQRFTGTRGDPSEHIHAGRIVRNRGTPSVEIPKHEFERAFESYRACMEALETANRR
jgi:hypothetical protein